MSQLLPNVLRCVWNLHVSPLGTWLYYNRPGGGALIWEVLVMDRYRSSPIGGKSQRKGRMVVKLFVKSFMISSRAVHTVTGATWHADHFCHTKFFTSVLPSAGIMIICLFQKGYTVLSFIRSILAFEFTLTSQIAHLSSYFILLFVWIILLHLGHYWEAIVENGEVLQDYWADIREITTVKHWNGHNGSACPTPLESTIRASTTGKYYSTGNFSWRLTQVIAKLK